MKISTILSIVGIGASMFGALITGLMGNYTAMVWALASAGWAFNCYCDSLGSDRA